MDVICSDHSHREDGRGRGVGTTDSLGPVSEPPDDDLVETLGLFVQAASRVTRGVQEDLQAEVGIRRTWFEVLMRLRRAPGNALRVTELAIEMGMPQSSATRLFDRLEASDLVRRVPDPSSRRSVLVLLAEQGHRRIADTLDAYTASARAHLGTALTEQQLQELRVICLALLDRNPLRAADLDEEGDVRSRRRAGLLGAADHQR